MTTISPAKYVRVNHESPANNIWFYEMTDGNWTIEYGSQHNTVMRSKIVESPQEDRALMPYTFLRQFDGIQFDLDDDYSVSHAMLDDEPAHLGLVRLWSGKTKYRVLDYTGLTIREVLRHIQQFYRHKTYRKALETHGSRFYGFMINTTKGETPSIMLDH